MDLERCGVFLNTGWGSKIRDSKTILERLPELVASAPLSHRFGIV